MICQTQKAAAKKKEATKEKVKEPRQKKESKAAEKKRKADEKIMQAAEKEVSLSPMDVLCYTFVMLLVHFMKFLFRCSIPCSCHVNKETFIFKLAKYQERIDQLEQKSPKTRRQRAEAQAKKDRKPAEPKKQSVATRKR